MRSRAATDIALPPTTVSTTFIPPASPPPIIKSSPPRRAGPIRGSLLGFLVGTTLTGLACYVFLLDEYRASSNSLLSSVEDVQTSVAKVRDYTRKIDRIDKDLKTHKAVAATVNDLESLRNELLKVIDHVHVAQLETKTQLWELTQSVVGASDSPKIPSRLSNGTASALPITNTVRHP
ncbi:hypothetical protein SeMB42_g03783 [Synchytrium endobioticum]|uniref:Uncharacterized protein n=1 Tax=Synchytrium endobioticum TaxID=286115 RepID=A0A507D4I8_9FUNG|nr:hypothetical protein SeMB42_g03783 [Synchytrium endobioticum]TPX48326.1 hypothetical protein SeLEV6574_g02083 [Synchytrium endobioticum]